MYETEACESTSEKLIYKCRWDSKLMRNDEEVNKIFKNMWAYSVRNDNGFIPSGLLKITIGPTKIKDVPCFLPERQECQK